ncbi:MAG: hypothetical protein K0S32_1551 [Bacteroidetes bacterium]|jgi:uncharacterized protein YciI|nr:hypothetical protein [Bacteroidota bacterium]
MKKLNLTLVFVLIVFVSFSQTKKETTKKPKYDEALAKKLKADDYGMHKYVMAFLKAGPNRNQDSATAAQLQAGHMANIERMAAAGDLVLAGPFMDKGEVRGIYIFNVESVEKAKELTETDPAIKAGRLIMELHPWYGSAALMQVNEVHNKIQKKGF